MIYEPLGKFVRLSQGLAVNKGTSYLFSNYKTDEFIYPLLRIVDLESGNHSTFSKYVSKDVSKSVVISEDTIVFSRVTCQCFRGFSGVVHNNLFVVEPINDFVSKDYLFTILQSSFVRNQALNLAKSSVVPDLTHDMFKSIRIPIPEKSEQNKIVAVYQSISSKISNNNAICADLEGMAKDLYDYWFVQFDFPDENGKPYKSSGGKMVWNEELKREIPDGWEVVSLETQFSITMGTSPEGKSINENEEGVPFYQGKTDFGFRFPAVRTYTTTPIRYAYRGDTLLSVRAPVGALNRAIETCCIGRGVASIHADEFPSYAYYTSLSLRPRFEKYNGDGTTFGCIGRDDLFAIPAVKPERSLIEKFEKITRQIDAKIENAEMENTELASLRDFLLPMLMNGQVKVKGA